MATATPAVPTAAEEVAGLDRVLTRLALTEDDKLEKVLGRLIPVVLGQLSSPHEATRKKVLEILAHVNKRIKGQPSLQLPLRELVSMYTAEAPQGTTAASYGMVRNFSLVYAEMAAERAPGAERMAVLSSLLTGISRRPPAHRPICLRIAAAALEQLGTGGVGGYGMSSSSVISLLQPPTAATAAAGAGAAASAGAATTASPSASAVAAKEGPRDVEMQGGGDVEGGKKEEAGEVKEKEEEMSAAEAAWRRQWPFFADAADRDIFLSYGLKLLLYTARTSRQPATPLAAAAAATAAAAAAAGGAAGAAPPPPPPPGLSPADVRQLEEKGALSAEQISRRKLGLLNLLAAAASIGPGMMEGGQQGPMGQRPAGQSQSQRQPPLPVGLLLPLLLVAAGDPAEAVARRGEELLRRSAALDAARPSADLDHPATLAPLLRLFHGSAVQLVYDTNKSDDANPAGGTTETAGSTAGGDESRRLFQQLLQPDPNPDTAATAAGPGLRSRLVAVFCRSIAFANLFPASLLTIQECVLPPAAAAAAVPSGAGGATASGGSGGAGGVYGRLRGQGLELCGWVFKHAGRHQLRAMGPVVMKGLLDTLDSTAAGGGGGMMDTATMTLRGAAYQALGTLSQRVPELMRSRTDIARRFFAALSDEPPGVRAAVQEATGALSRAYVVEDRGLYDNLSQAQEEGDVVRQLDELLLESIRSPKDAVRLAAVQWACRLFPFHHVPARWVCILAAGDSRHDVREEGANGLKPPAAAAAAAGGSGTGREGTAGGGAAAAGAGAAAGAAAPGRSRLPSLYSLLSYVRHQLPRLRHPADPLSPLPLPPRSTLALISLLRACRHVTGAIHTTMASPIAARVPSTGAADAASTNPGGGSSMAAREAAATAMEVDEGEGEGEADEERVRPMGHQGDPDLLLKADDTRSLLVGYQTALEWGLCRVEGNAEVAAAALEALVEAAAEEEEQEGEQEEGRQRWKTTDGRVVAGRYVSRTAWLRSLLSHPYDITTRTAAARLLGSHVAGAMGAAEAGELLSSLCAQLAPLTSNKPSSTATAAAAAAAATPAAAAPIPAASQPASHTPAHPAPTHVKPEEAEGCLLAIGFMLASAATTGSPALQPAAITAAVHTLTAVLCGCSSGASSSGSAVPSPLSEPTAPAFVRATAALALSYSCAAGPQPALLLPAASVGVDGNGGAGGGTGGSGSGSGTGGDTVAAATAATAVGMDVDKAAPKHEEEQKQQQQQQQTRRVLDLVVDRILDLIKGGDGSSSSKSSAADAGKVTSRALAAAGFLAGGWGGAWVWGPEDAVTPSDPRVGAGAAGSTSDPRVGRVAERLLEGVFSVASSKSEDVQFAAGEALAWAFGGLPASLPPAVVLRGNYTSLADSLGGGQKEVEEEEEEEEEEAEGEEEGAEVEQQDAKQSEGEGEEAAVVLAGQAALRQAVLGRLLGELLVSSRSEFRCAGAVWLVSLLGCCGGGGARELSSAGGRLPEIQEALSGLLGDPNELTQEMASRGVSLVYELGDEEIREQLVQRLVAVLQGGGGAAGGKPKLTPETQIFEEGALGSLPASGGAGGGGAAGSSGTAAGSSSGSSGGGGGGLSTYKELCALATDLGQPDLIYKFMDLAHHAAALNSRRGAAFGFASIARMAARGGRRKGAKGTRPAKKAKGREGKPSERGPQAVLTAHLDALVPKLYRYTHDPNPRVAEAMVAIWRALVDDPRVTLDKHFPAIMSDLLREMGGRLWRNRQAACGAAEGLLQGRRWPELAPYFAQLWTMMFRAMDDIKDSVRRAAVSLSRTVRGLTLRLADPAHTSAKDCTAAVSEVLPVLLGQGLTSSVAEVRGLSVEVLSLLSRSAPPAALRPLLGAMVPALLEALSNMEDARLNYVEQHAERWGLDAERLEGARVAAARGSPLGDTLDLAARLADASSLETLVPALVTSVRRGVGLNTKVGTARFIRLLASRPSALTSGGGGGGVGSSAAGSGASASQPPAQEQPLLRSHAAPLLRALVAAVRGERSGTVRKAYAAAAAQVVRHASEKRQDKFVEEALLSYNDPGADVDSRLSGGLLLRQLQAAAPELLRRYDTTVLPTAFAAKMDPEDKEVAAVWGEVWEEGVSSEPAALRLYGGEVCTALVEALGGQQWGRKRAAAEATVKLTEIAPDALGDHGRRLASALLAELRVGRLWEGKETLLGAIAALVAADPRVVSEAATDPRVTREAAIGADDAGHAALVEVLMAAVQRKKMSYRTAALTALNVVLRSLPGCHWGRVAPRLMADVERHCEPAAATAASATASTTTPPTESGTAAGGEDAPPAPLPLPECLTCLSTAFTRVGTAAAAATAGTADTSAAAAAGEEVESSGRQFAGVLGRVLGAGWIGWQGKMAAAAAVAAVAQRCSAVQLSPASSAALLGRLSPALLATAQDFQVHQLRMACLTALSAITTAVQPPAVQPPAVQPPAVQPPAVQPPAVQPPSATTTAVQPSSPSAGWSEADRRQVLPGLVAGLRQLAG
ncbi:hypothetical protein Agub_g8793, partial [Astrephomene gubernaculifera]